MILLHGSSAVVRSATEVVPHGAVCVDGDRIAAVGPSAELEAAYPNADRIDCAGMVLTPGFVNGHNHVYGILCRGLGKGLTTEEWLRRLVLPVNTVLDGDDLHAAAALVCADAFRTGTTGMIEQATNLARFHVDAEFRAFSAAGIRAGLARGASTVSTVDARDTGDPDTELAATREYLDRWADSERVRPWVGPSGLFACDPDTLVRLKELAREHAARFVIHLSETRAQVELAERNGYRGQVEWADAIGLLDADTVVAHAIWASPEEIRTLADRGVHVVHSPISNMLMASGIADVTAMIDAGVGVALGADTPAANDAQDMLAEIKMTALLQRTAKLDPTVLDARTCWRLGTEGGAAALGHAGELGRLEAGWLADIVGFQVGGNPCMTPIHDPVESLVYHGSGRDVALTMVDGRVVYDRGRYPTIDLAATVEHVESVVVPKIQDVMEG